MESHIWVLDISYISLEKCYYVTRRLILFIVNMKVRKSKLYQNNTFQD